MKKNKVEQHAWSCGNYSVSCVDCNVCFPENEYKEHNSCVSEAEKYQGKLYKPKFKRVQAPARKEVVEISNDHDKENEDPQNVKIDEEETKEILKKFSKSHPISQVDKLVRKKAVKFAKKQYRKKGKLGKSEKIVLKTQIKGLLCAFVNK